MGSTKLKHFKDLIFKKDEPVRINKNSNIAVVLHTGKVITYFSMLLLKGNITYK